LVLGAERPPSNSLGSGTEHTPRESTLEHIRNPEMPLQRIRKLVTTTRAAIKLQTSHIGLCLHAPKMISENAGGITKEEVSSPAHPPLPCEQAEKLE
jgi:hypothetical protein